MTKMHLWPWADFESGQMRSMLTLSNSTPIMGKGIRCDVVVSGGLSADIWDRLCRRLGCIPGQVNLTFRFSRVFQALQWGYFGYQLER